MEKKIPYEKIKCTVFIKGGQVSSLDGKELITMTTLKDFDSALICAYGAAWYMQNYYSRVLVECFNALDTDTKEKCRPLMENFRVFLRENVGEEYEEYLTSMSIK